MSTGDFDIDSLAAYLHLAPDKVRQMADRGKLPGRKIGGQWRFAEAEIHHWLEDSIGASDDTELERVEGVLRNAQPGIREISIADSLPLEAIAVPLAARTRTSVIDQMIETATRTGWLWDPDKMAEAVAAREQLHSTALDIGVALLHPRRPQANILAQAVPRLWTNPSRDSLRRRARTPDRCVLPDTLDRRSTSSADPGPLESFDR